MRPHPTIRTIVLLLALVLAACTSPGAEDAAQAPTPTRTARPGPTPTSTPDDPASRCTSPIGVAVTVPAGWTAVADCGRFGPVPLAEPEPGTDERPGPISIHHERVPFADVAAPDPAVVDRALTTVRGLQAVRLERVADGEGLLPVGTRQTQWMVDLDPGTDERAGTLLLTATATPRVDHAAASTALDTMVRTLSIPHSPDDADGVVARFEGGGAPVVVLAAPSASTAATCVRTRPAIGDPVCMDPPADGGLVTVPLSAPAGPLTVGLVGPDVARVELTAQDTDGLAVLPVDVAARDVRAFVAPVEEALVDDVVLREDPRSSAPTTG